MTDIQPKQAWKPGKRDLLFFAVIAAVVLALSLGSHERRTAATPNDAVHISSSSRQQCMHCHDSASQHPQPAAHPKAKQCFQCHTQPENWKGASRKPSVSV